jgi:hypothetical protein
LPPTRSQMSFNAGTLPWMASPINQSSD